MHDHRSDFDPFRRWEAMARRRFRDAQQGFQGNFAGWGGNIRLGRMLAAGDLRLIVLYLIEQQPRHGYELIKAIEEKTGGIYSPSPGMIYPALTYLEEAGYAASTSEGNKKSYAITDTGRTYLGENREAVEGLLTHLGNLSRRMKEFRDQFAGSGTPGGDDAKTHMHHDHHDHPSHRGGPFAGRGPSADRDIRDVLPEVNDARRELKAAIAEAVAQGPDAQRRLAAILNRAAAEIRDDSGDDEVDLG